MGRSGTACREHRPEYTGACPACRERNRLHKLRQRRRRGVPERQTWLASKRGRAHGTRTGYTHGCRCAACTEAERVYKAELRARRALRQPVTSSQTEHSGEPGGAE